MRRFTFATGNARKILALPLYGLGALAGALVPRSSRLWVFGSGIGVGEGALPLLQYARRVDPSLRTVWLARNDRDIADARELGIVAVRAGSWRGFRLTLRASVIVVTHGFGDANRFATRGGFVVQLWHGIPHKRIHLDSPAALRVPLLSRFAAVRTALREAYVRSGRGIGMFATASTLAAERIRTAFALPPERIAVTGDPRDDVLFEETAPVRRQRARERLADLLDDDRMLTARILLFAPTWRDGAQDPSVPSHADWRRLAEYLEASDSLLIVRSHHLGTGDYALGPTVTNRVALLGPEAQADITPLLPAADALITDYSSIAFDYALCGGEIPFFAPDLTEYGTARGTYEPYREFSGGNEVVTWSGLIDLLEANDTDPATHDRLVAHSAWLADRFHAYRDGHNTQRVYDEIVSRLRGAPTSSHPPDAKRSLRVDSLTVEGGAAPMLTLSGATGGLQPRSISASGARAQLPGTLTVSGARWNATLPLLVSRWHSAARPVPSGQYRVRVLDQNARPLVLTVTAPIPAPRLHEGLFRLNVDGTGGALQVTFGAPLTDTELGKTQQERLEARYRAASAAPENAVFFESYYGQNASCNPRGIDRALAELRPDVVRYWSVADASVEVPPGATAIVEGSEPWWSVRASARLLVVNDWLRKRYRKRRGQAVLQTWHGTPLKRMALDRKGARLAPAVATFREKARWDLMLAQNDYSARVFRSAYAFRSTIWQEGYPRDDILLTGDAQAVRERLGIEPGVTVVLYAPTWRDDRPGKVDHLDARRFAEDLGPGFVTLIRGHSRTMRPGEDVIADHIIDVTGYPDISELFLVADALVTDYSSVMFDFTVTGKPVFFFVPDFAHYRDQVRGFSFDLLPVAPGPVLEHPAELVEELRNLDARTGEYAERYAAWQQRFNPRDDGHAGERVVRRLIAEGFLD